MEIEIKKKLGARLRRVEGQVAALQRMVQGESACGDVLLQISAAQGALGKVGEQLLSHHIEKCVSDALRSGGAAERQRTVNELMNVFSRYSRIGGK